MYYFYTSLIAGAAALIAGGFISGAQGFAVAGFYLLVQLLIAARKEWTKEEMRALREQDRRLKEWAQEEEARSRQERWCPSTVIRL